MKIQKILYYFKSAFILYTESKSKINCILVLLRFKSFYRFKNNLIFEIKSLLDLLILKETLIDDFYQLKKIEGTSPKVIVDIGGGFGDFSIFSAKLFPYARILVFEPNPILYKLLKNNAKRNNIKNITMYPYAVSNNKRIQIDISGEPTKTSMFFDKKKVSKTIGVRTKRLSDIIKKDSIDFLKIDCEGGEWDILSNLSNQELTKIKTISLEYHNQYITNLDEKIVKVLNQSFNVFQRQDIFDDQIGHIYATRE